MGRLLSASEGAKSSDERPSSEGENLRGNVLTVQTVTQTAEILAGQGVQDVHPGRTPAPHTYSVRDEDLKKRSGGKTKKA
jgi:hypothetical protein